MAESCETSGEANVSNEEGNNVGLEAMNEKIEYQGSGGSSSYSSQGVENKVLTFTADNLNKVVAPSIKEKIHRFLYDRGLGSMPPYLREMYINTPRYVYVNCELPAFMKKHFSGNPIIQYPRNKIRTTRYTPLTFLPRDIIFQFTNVANSYFLILIILGAFPVFGVQNPGLAAVPLIVIVAITAAKDAFEEYRRGNSDSILNNSPIHLLTGLDNPNVLADNVGPWRKFKKKSSKRIRRMLKWLSKMAIMIFAKKTTKLDYMRNEKIEEENALRRVSTVVSNRSYDSEHIAVLSEGRMSTQSRRSKPLSVPRENSVVSPDLYETKGASAKFKNRCWKDINIGDFIRIRNNEEVPADVIIVSSSDPESNCFVETKNLDGETNLKTKAAFQAAGSNAIRHSGDLSNAKFWVECDPPNGQLYNFKGILHYENYDSDGKLVNSDEKESLSIKNLLLRGSTVRNTKWVIGLVVYTGAETKIMLNTGITASKRSKISKELNLSVIINFLLLFVLCFISGLINGLFYNKKHNSRMYFDFHPYGSNSASRGVIGFFVALIIYQSLVPISLYISVEIIKSLQAFFIYSDIKMYYDKLDFPCTPKTWNVSDDLGQIEYVFSDKTGTLTQNVMEFRKCSINGKSYGLAYSEVQQGIDKRAGKDPMVEMEKWRNIINEDKEIMAADLQSYSKNDQFDPQSLTFVSSEFVKDTFVCQESSKSLQKKANEEFMLALALCHTVVTEKDPNGSPFLLYKSESPDEAALVNVAKDTGFVFRERLRNSLKLSFQGAEQEYELLALIPFTSARKRMSCILKYPNGTFHLLTKGADNVIFSRLNSNNDDEVIKRTALHLESYANEGLRTLCIASKELDVGYLDSWLGRFKELSASIDDNREELLDIIYDEIETDLNLLGGTAIEDRLQQGVPDSISILGQAGIKLWVLTGDRIETAINIGFSCNLLDNGMKLLVIRPDENDPSNARYIDETISKHLKDNFDIFGNKEVTSSDIDSYLSRMKQDHSVPSSKFAIVIDGGALDIVFDKYEEDSPYKDVQKKLLILGKQCKSVLCCRVSPAQKAAVVLMVKNMLNVMTLAIGDGANDVAMIQAANIGIGIAGEEGRQAVMSSDYAIGQFRFLTRLLLVHGRWSYKRLAEMVPCFFYKNVVFTLTCFWYGIYNNFDGSYLYEYTYLMFYNLAFTSLPVIFLAVLDQDVSDTVSLIVPTLYKSGILGEEWSQYKFVWYMLDGLYQSVISFYMPYLLFYKGFSSMQGLPVDHRFFVGVVSVCISVPACNIYVLLQQFRWDWLSLLINALSILVVFFWTGVWSARVYAGEFYKAGATVFGTLSCWCTIFVGILSCILPRFAHDYLKQNFAPRDVDIIRERALAGEYSMYPEAYDPTDVEDVERLKLVNEIRRDPDVMVRIEKEIEQKHNSTISNSRANTIQRTFKTIKRRATLSRSNKTLTNQAIHAVGQLDLNELRRRMASEQDANGSSNYSLNRVDTTQEVPGLTQAETLLLYHTNSLKNNT